MSRYRPQPPRKKKSGGCLRWLVLLIWLVLMLVLGYQYFWRNQVSEQIGQQIVEKIAPTISVGGDAQSPGQGGEVGGVLPTVIAALPSGELRITEQEANEYLTANVAELQPAERVQVRFVPGELQADIVAFGLTSTARTGLAIQDGRVVTVNARLDGPLGAFVDVTSLTQPLEQQLNAQLAAQGKRVTNVRIEQGALVFTVE